MSVDEFLLDHSPRLFRFLNGRLVTFSVRDITDVFQACDSMFESYSKRVVFAGMDSSWLEVDPDCDLDSRTSSILVHDKTYDPRLWEIIYSLMTLDYIALLSMKPACVLYSHVDALKHFQDDIVNPRLVPTRVQSARDLIQGLRDS